MNLPKHEGELQLTHNPHKSNYETVAQWIQHNDWFDFIDPEQKERSLKTNEIWIMRWYPKTPVGFNAVAAPTLEELLAVWKGEGDGRGDGG